jgi:hypothetical protein
MMDFIVVLIRDKKHCLLNYQVDFLLGWRYQSFPPRAYAHDKRKELPQLAVCVVIMIEA